MVSANIIKVDYAQISNAIQSFVAADQCGNSPNFIVTSLDTLKLVQCNNLYLMSSSDILDFSHTIMGVPIAVNNTLELGEIRVV